MIRYYSYVFNFNKTDKTRKIHNKYLVGFFLPDVMMTVPGVVKRRSVKYAAEKSINDNLCYVTGE